MEKVKNSTLSKCICKCILSCTCTFLQIQRKLLEGEETRFGTGMMYTTPNHGPSLNYGYQTRTHASSTKKKEKEEESQGKSKMAAQREMFEEIIEETIVTKKVDKSDVVEENSN